MMLQRLLICVALVLTLPVSVQAQQARPLLIEGKTSLFQRVLVRERISQRDAPDGIEGKKLSPLQALYVYQRNDAWVQVGNDDKGDDLFWIPATAAVDWNQNIVVTFEGSENLNRVLFFNDIDTIYDIIESEDPAIAAKIPRDEALAAENGGPASDTVVALGPRRLIDQRKNLYVMPILSAEEGFFDSGSFVNLLKVAVASTNAGQAAELPVPKAGAGQNLKTAVVFVVDTTISMEPYIRGTQEALQEVYKQVANSEAAEAVSFGLVGYRDNLEAAPGLEYASRTFVDLQQGYDGDQFLAGITRMTEANTTSRNFREDSYGGIEHALQMMDWSEFGSRFIILVTDAGPREAGDAYSSTQLSAQGLNRVVQERIGGALAVMHLKSPRGVKDHPSAEQAYRELSAFPNSPPLYFSIENGDPGQYRETAHSLGQFIVDQSSSYLRADGNDVLNEDRIEAPEDGRFSGLHTAGRTMQLAYLGTRSGEKAPDLFEAYVADRDYDRPGLKPLSIRLLISKSDLSNLEEALRIIIEQSEENVINPNQFFAQVLGAAADMSRRPDKVSRQSEPSLAEAVALDEYLEDLPYTSQIMQLTEDEWIRLSFSEQQAIVNGLYEKIERYRRYNEATDQWVDYLGTGAVAADLLYPMLLDDLP